MNLILTEILFLYENRFFPKTHFSKHDVSKLVFPKTRLEILNKKFVWRHEAIPKVCVWQSQNNLPLSSRFWQNQLKILTKKKNTNLESLHSWLILERFYCAGLGDPKLSGVQKCESCVWAVKFSMIFTWNLFKQTC